MITTRLIRSFFSITDNLPYSPIGTLLLTYNGLFHVKIRNTVVFRMTSSTPSYEEAVKKLNSLQSNKSTLQQIRLDLKNGKKCTNLEDMENYLQRVGITLSMLDNLSVIHVAGTKGKGSTSAMCESILRTHGYRTGFYSSPHLVAVRERVRLCGQILSERVFAQYFHQVYDSLYQTQAFPGDMPKYFAFLTVMAFSVFLKEKVDVAIVEVGIGGIVDYTNILRKVPIVGITSLGLDHTSILGNTLAEIAAAKAGIMKPGCAAYTVQQPAEAMDVLRTVASKVQCSLQIVPEYTKYSFENGRRFDISLEAYKINASLAIQLAHGWMRAARHSTRKHHKKQANGKILTNGYSEIDPVLMEYEKNVLLNTLPKETVLGLEACEWPGRYHVIKTDYAEFYLDGAHTKESIEICAKWFDENSRFRDKILIFSATGDRDAEVLLKPLQEITFKCVYFVIPKANKETTEENDNYSVIENDELILRCKNHANVWQSKNQYTSKSFVMDCVADTLLHIEKENLHSDVKILITGSLHLVGAALWLLNSKI